MKPKKIYYTMNQREKDSKLLEAQKERKIMKSSKIIFNMVKSTKPKFDASKDYLLKMKLKVKELSVRLIFERRIFENYYSRIMN